MDNDLEIIKLIRLGNKDLYADIIRRYHEKIVRLCFGMLGPHGGVDDAVQEIFIKAYKSLDSFAEQSLFSTWLFRLSTNHCLDLLRKKSRQKTDSLDELISRDPYKNEVNLFSGEAIGSFDPQKVLIAEEVLSQLTPEYRAIIVLREFENLNYQEIANTLNSSLDSVKAKLKRARQQISKKLRHLLKVENV